jgi:hypothetical protein
MFVEEKNYHACSINTSIKTISHGYKSRDGHPAKSTPNPAD